MLAQFKRNLLHNLIINQTHNNGNSIYLKNQIKQCKQMCFIGEQLEGLGEHAVTLCKFQCFNYGCTKMVSIVEMKQHLCECEAEEMWCPFAIFCQNIGVQFNLQFNLTVCCSFKS